jgi:hypothetical protein
MIMRGLTALVTPVLALHVMVAPASAAPASTEPAPRPLSGRYALDLPACRAGDNFLTLGPDRLDLPVFSCQGLTFTPETAAGDRVLWSVSARRCEGEEGAPGPRRFRIEANGATLRILWPDGTKSAPLRRCGR